MKKYEEPKITFSEFRLDQNVANPCWALAPGHPHDKEYFYDVDGKGYVGFHIKSVDGSCGAPDAYNIYYYEYYGAVGDKEKGSTYEQFLEEELTKYGGNNGQPYQGIKHDFPDNPDPSWS